MALQFFQHALDIRIKLFGEEHQSTADCYYSLGVTQRKQGDFKAALQSFQRALDIRIKLFGEEHQRAAKCRLDDFKAVVQQDNVSRTCVIN